MKYYASTVNMFRNKNIHKHKSEVLVILYSHNIDEQSLNSRYAIGFLFDLLFVFFFSNFLLWVAIKILLLVRYTTIDLILLTNPFCLCQYEQITVHLLSSKGTLQSVGS